MDFWTLRELITTRRTTIRVAIWDPPSGSKNDAFLWLAVYGITVRWLSEVNQSRCAELLPNIFAVISEGAHFDTLAAKLLRQVTLLLCNLLDENCTYCSETRRAAYFFTLVCLPFASLHCWSGVTKVILDRSDRGYIEKSSQREFCVHLRHALLKCSVPCWTHQPHSTQRTTGMQLVWLYCATEILLTSLTATFCHA